MEAEGKSTPIAKAVGLGRLSLLLLVSTLGIASGWHLLYGVTMMQAIAVVGEIAVLVALAFVCAWRWSR